jgi:peptidyl-prolyl cis-trans isomerase B (cyclophilin B)
MNMRKRLFAAVLTVVCLLCGCGGKQESQSAAEPVENAVVDIVVKDYGTITVELDGEAAPITVANFVKLAEEGFYDGLTFHRIMAGFMMQGGDPKGNGTGGSDEKIKGEFSANGVENPLSHTRGAISIEMEKVLSATPDGQNAKAEKVLEINTDHALFARLQAAEDEQLKTYAEVLYNQALLIEGLPIEDPVAYANAIWTLLV